MKYLLGDSHLGRLTADELLGLDIDWQNLATQGATAGTTLEALLRAPELQPGDVAIVSLGTHDALPMTRTPLPVFEAQLDQIFRALVPAHIAYLIPPGADDERLTGAHERTSSSLARWSRAGADLAIEHGLLVLDLPVVLQPLGAAAFCEDGLHLSPQGNAALVELLVAAARSFE